MAATGTAALQAEISPLRPSKKKAKGPKQTTKKQGVKK